MTPRFAARSATSAQAWRALRLCALLGVSFGTPLANGEPAPDASARSATEQSALLAQQGRAYLIGGQPALAVQMLEEAVRLDPRNPITRVSLGDAYVSAQRPSDAKAAFQATVDLDPLGPYGARARSALQLLDKIEADHVRALRRR